MRALLGILGCRFFPFITLNISCHSLLACIVSAEKNQLIIVFYLNKFIYFIYLFLAALGLCCCERAFSSCSELGLLFVVVASLVAEHGL